MCIRFSKQVKPLMTYCNLATLLLTYLVHQHSKCLLDLHHHQFNQLFKTICGCPMVNLTWKCHLNVMKIITVLTFYNIADLGYKQAVYILVYNNHLNCIDLIITVYANFKSTNGFVILSRHKLHKSLYNLLL